MMIAKREIAQFQKGANRSNLYTALLFALLALVSLYKWELMVTSKENPPMCTSSNLELVTPRGAELTEAAGLSHAAPRVGRIAKRVLVEVGVLMALQTVGLPIFAQLASQLRQSRVLSAFVTRTGFARRLGPVVRNIGSNSGKAWKSLSHVYKKTGASKIVQRTKKMVHFALHAGDHDDEEHHEHH